MKWMGYACYFGIILIFGFEVPIFIALLYFTTPSPGQSFAEAFQSERYK
jgi:hypothetical protein